MTGTVVTRTIEIAQFRNLRNSKTGKKKQFLSAQLKMTCKIRTTARLEGISRKKLVGMKRGPLYLIWCKPN